MRRALLLAAALASLTSGARAQEEDGASGEPGPPPPVVTEPGAAQEEPTDPPADSVTVEDEPPAAPTPPSSPEPPSPVASAAATPASTPAIDLSDPTASTPVPGMAPELAPPSLDLVAANFSVSTTGTRITAAVSPFRFLDDPIPFLSQASVRLVGDSGNRTWGGALTLGHNAGRERLYRPRAACREHFNRRIRAITAEVQERVTAFQPRDVFPNDSQYLRHLIDQLPQAERARYERGLEAAQSARAECAGDDYRQFAVREAFTTAYAINVSVAANLFAIVDEPPVVDAAGAETDPTAHLLRDWSATLSAALFLSEHSAFWLSAAFSQRRPDANTAPLDGRFGLGATLASFVPFGDATDQGFRPGFAFGVGATYSLCTGTDDTMGNAATCQEKFDGYPSAARISDAVQVTPFFDIRIDTKLQLRIAVVVDAFVVDQPVPMTAAGPGDVIVRVVPTLSATTSQWSF